MKKTLINILIVLSIGPLFFITIHFLTNSGEETAKEIELEFLDLEIKGTVHGKFIDTPNHAVETIIFKTFDGKEIRELFSFETAGLWDYLSVGDSVFKNKQVAGFEIKNGLKDSVFVPVFKGNPKVSIFQ